jgi:FkbM family methyltransferase
MPAIIDSLRISSCRLLLRVYPHWRTRWWHERAQMMAAARRPVVVEIGGLHARFLVRCLEDYRILCAGHLERDAIARFLEQLWDDDIVYDVGAHRGYWAVLAALRVRRGRVYAFEPEPGNAQRLREHAQLNALTNLHVLEIALSDRAGKAQFQVGGAGTDSTNSLLVKSGAGRTIEVELLPGDDVPRILRVPAPTAVKIDVEGGELAVLAGLEQMLRGDRLRLIQVEIHDAYLRAAGLDPDRVPALLTGAGFTPRHEHRRADQTLALYQRP